MATRRTNPSQRLAAQSLELAWAAPQVVGGTPIGSSSGVPWM